MTAYLQTPSPNFGTRRGGATPSVIVVHYTAMQTCADALSRLRDPKHEVSAHYLIDTDGTILALVDEHVRAWHAGAGRWGACRDINSHSIGIELAQTGQTPFAWPQIGALIALMQDIKTRWRIPRQNVIAHSDLAPARKSDPGPRFDWQLLARLGLAVWPQNCPKVAPEAFWQAAVQFGYPVADVNQSDCLRAFRLHFRPWAKGPLDAVDAGLITDLAARFGVDQSAKTA